MGSFIFENCAGGSGPLLSVLEEPVQKGGRRPRQSDSGALSRFLELGVSSIVM